MHCWQELGLRTSRAAFEPMVMAVEVATGGLCWRWVCSLAHFASGGWPIGAMLYCCMAASCNIAQHKVL